MERKLLSFIFLSLPVLIVAQWRLASKIDLPQTPSTYATDVGGNLYVGYKDGSLVKYNSQGEELLNFSLSNQSPISLIEPQFQLKTFLFYFDNQVITILDRFNTLPKNYPVREYTNGIVSMACPAPDGTFWMVENNPSVLKRVDPIRLSTILETQPSLGSEIKQMKAYQNFLLILDEVGLRLFDQYGSQIFEINKDISSFVIQNDQLFCLSEAEILEIDMSEGKVKATQEAPEQAMDAYLPNDDTSFFLQGSTLYIFEAGD